MRKNVKSKVAYLLTLAMAFSVCNPSVSVDAAKKKYVAVKKITVTDPAEKELVMKKGSTYTIKYKITPSNASNKVVSYISNNPKIVTVSPNGVVKAVRGGKAKISVVSNNNKKDSFNVKVGEPVSNIQLNMTKVTLTEGSKTDLSAKVTPAKADNKKLTYESSDTSVVTVSSNGKIKAVKKGSAIILVSATDGSGVTATCKVTVKAKKPTKTPTPSVTPTVSPSCNPIYVPTSTPTTDIVPPIDSSYKLVWEDNFDTFDLSNWNYECHEPGWVNNELQQYTDSDKNIYAEDGCLVIKANKDGDKITSGKVTTAGKKEFKYGRFDIRAKGIEGKGLWPAIWMMPQSENFYGQWPRCGEIDIMEILGHEPNKSYATIHYGNPHKEKQGTYTAKESLADDFHVYSLDWQPDKMKFYVDGVLINEVSDWYTATEGKGTITYPAPFDQLFYLQLNLAVGGNWPGNPDETTNFDNAKFMIDYVKVYQKDYYDENVKAPEKEKVTLRDPDTSGNYIVNGDFSVKEDLTDDTDWGFKTALGGVGELSIDDKTLICKTDDYGTVDYSIQIVQPNVPMAKGGQYEVSFKAKADEARTMITNVTGPDNSYVRYFADTLVNLGTEYQDYKYTFTMEQSDDPNGRLEFNLGNQKSNATVYIQDVKIKKVGQGEVASDKKTILSNGNYVYNGEFQEGENRLGFWTVVNKNGTVKVSNDDGVRELVATGNSTTELEDLGVEQEVAISTNKEYVLTYDARATKEMTMKATVDGNVFEDTLTTGMKSFKHKFKTEAQLKDQLLKFVLGSNGTVYLDNVRLAEDGLLVNGDFVNDFVGWDPFVDGGITSSVVYTVDSQKYDQAAAFEINDTGDQDWKIQLIQDGVVLEKGKWYELQFKAKTDLASGRKIKYGFSHNGSSDNNWNSYSPEKFADLTSDWQTFSVKFGMTSETDELSRLSFTMGAVNGVQITQHHNVYIDDVTLVEVEPEEINVPVIEGNMLKNADFSDGTENWETVASAPGAANYATKDGAINVEITNVGTEDYHIQMKQKIAGLINGHTYKLKMKIDSTTSRTVKSALLTSSYDWYGGADIAVTAGETKEVDTDIYVSKDTSNDITFYISLGKIAGEDTEAGTVSISEISLEDVTE